MQFTNHLMQSLNVENHAEGLRYDKVILATDVPQCGMDGSGKAVFHAGSGFILAFDLAKKGQKVQNRLCDEQNPGSPLAGQC